MNIQEWTDGTSQIDGGHQDQILINFQDSMTILLLRATKIKKTRTIEITNHCQYTSGIKASAGLVDV
jgi:hypothetical protein